VGEGLQRSVRSSSRENMEGKRPEEGKEGRRVGIGLGLGEVCVGLQFRLAVRQP